MIRVVELEILVVSQIKIKLTEEYTGLIDLTIFL